MQKFLFFIAILGLFLVVGTNTTQATHDQTIPKIAELPRTTITVSAAASLTDVFPVIARSFSARYPNLTVQLNLGSSNSLVEQLRAGAPFDVLATASELTMRTAVREGWVSPRPLLFAKNFMVIAMPAGNPAKITSLGDLQSSRVLTAVCAIEAPCGLATRRLFSLNNLSSTPVTKELDVRAVLGKVVADQVDAGIIYATDARSAGKSIMTIAIPANKNVSTSYLIASVSYTSKKQAAEAFVDYVRNSPTSQSILRNWGFGK